jgi:hypothetical protein
MAAPIKNTTIWRATPAAPVEISKLTPGTAANDGEQQIKTENDSE